VGVRAPSASHHRQIRLGQAEGAQGQRLLFSNAGAIPIDVSQPLGDVGHRVCVLRPLRAHREERSVEELDVLVLSDDAS
jgi:hypothetical protein